MKTFVVQGKDELAFRINDHLKAQDLALGYEIGPEGTLLLMGRPTLARENVRFDYVDQAHRSGRVKAGFTYVVHGEPPAQYTGLHDDSDTAVALAFWGAARDGQALLVEGSPPSEPEPAQEEAAT